MNFDVHTLFAISEYHFIIDDCCSVGQICRICAICRYLCIDTLMMGEFFDLLIEFEFISQPLSKLTLKNLTICRHSIT